MKSKKNEKKVGKKGNETMKRNTEWNPGMTKNNFEAPTPSLIYYTTYFSILRTSIYRIQSPPTLRPSRLSIVL